MTNKKQQRQVKPKQTKRKSSTVTVQILKGVSLDIQSHVEDMIAEHVGMLWDRICERNRAAEETLRRELALHEHAKIERNTLLAQRGAEIQELKEQLSSCEGKLSGALQELEQVRKIHRLPQMVQLELDSLRKELDKERAAARAVRAHAAYDRQKFASDMADRSVERDMDLRAARDEIARLEEQLKIEREAFEKTLAERCAPRRSARAEFSVEESVGVPPAEGVQFNVNETKES